MKQAKQIMQPFMLRRLKSEVLSQLPAKVLSTEYCELTEAQQRLYTATVDRSLKVSSSETSNGKKEITVSTSNNKPYSKETGQPLCCTDQIPFDVVIIVRQVL